MIYRDCIIFDVDGTLWDSREILANAYNEQLAAEGITDLHVTPEILKPLFGKTMTDLADGLFEGYIPAPERYAFMDRCILRMNEHLEKYASPAIGYPDLRRTCQILALEHRLFIVSNGQKGYPQLAAKALGLDDLIEDYLSFGDTGLSKGQTIKLLMQKAGTTSAAYVGDTQADWDACCEAWTPFVWASYGFGKPSFYTDKIDRFSDLIPLFNQIHHTLPQKYEQKNVQENAQENVQENAQENAQENVQENVQENAQENVQKNDRKKVSSIIRKIKDLIKKSGKS